MDVERPIWGSTLIKNHHENKTYILVKLSESFSNAIQEYSAPTIKFQGTRGAIKFPNGKSYDFSLEQSDNTVECIRQTKNRFESVAKMACCLHVKGKDDVYQRTRTKMEAAEQEKRKYCTKLLGDSPENNNDMKQLKRYRADFNKDFKEYQNLHGYLHKIEERFKSLRDSLQQSAEGSPEWESAKEQIFNEYERLKGDSDFHRARSKYKQLHNKLTYIKAKIFQFKRKKKDINNHSTSSSGTTSTTTTSTKNHIINNNNNHHHHNHHHNHKKRK